MQSHTKSKNASSCKFAVHIYHKYRQYTVYSLKSHTFKENDHPPPPYPKTLVRARLQLWWLTTALWQITWIRSTGEVFWACKNLPTCRGYTGHWWTLGTRQCIVCCPFKITTRSVRYVTFHPANINLIHYLSGRPATVLSSIRMCVLLLHIATLTKPLGVGTLSCTSDIWL